MFDPQKIAQEEPHWWWNTLSYVTDEEKAYKLNQHFSVGSRVPGSKPDAYFDPKAEDILSSYFLAAALGGLPITQVYLWVTEQVNREPINILKTHDYELQYRGLESTLELADKQRDGIFGTAEKMIQCLKSRNTLRWVAPTGGTTVATDTRPRFNPHAFAASRETIYILSKKGAGSAAPLTTALTVAIAEAMEERAERSGGRLPQPALFALDELANVVRWAGQPGQHERGRKDRESTGARLRLGRRNSCMSSCRPPMSAASPGNQQNGAQSGTSTPKQSHESQQCGVPGNTCASTTQTTTCVSSWTHKAPSTTAT